MFHLLRPSRQLYERAKIRGEFGRYRKIYLESFKGLMTHALQNIEKASESTSPYNLQRSSSFVIDKRTNWIAMMQSSGAIQKQQNQINTMMTSSPPLLTYKFKEYFEVIKVIGRGGFGKVLEAKNKLDGVVYAVKQIKLKEKGVTIDKILREVKALARLEHKNVCRYFNSWIETIFDEENKLNNNNNNYNKITDIGVESILRTGSGSNSWDSENSDVDEISLQSNSNSNCIVFPSARNFNENSLENSKSYNYVPISNNNENIDFSDDSIVFEDEAQNMALVKYTKNNFMNNSNSSANNSKQKFKPYYVLYIQMQLYESKTLKEFLEKENRAVNRAENLDIMKQIIEGLSHIHSKRIIHRDVKPGNLFISIDGTVKIGDFGLSTFEIIPEELTTVNDVGEVLCEITGGIGTKSYASPEQLAGNNYSYKTDVFSCGLILFELFFPMKTMSEKISAFRDVRNGHLPPVLLKNYPNESAMILWLVKEDPCERPSTSEILESPLFRCKTDVKDLQLKLAESEHTIRKQKERIEELEKKLAQLSAK